MEGYELTCFLRSYLAFTTVHTTLDQNKSAHMCDSYILSKDG
jgi:hypothetical protein